MIMDNNFLIVNRCESNFLIIDNFLIIGYTFIIDNCLIIGYSLIIGNYGQKISKCLFWFR